MNNMNNINSMNNMNYNQDTFGKGNQNKPKNVGHHASGTTENNGVKHQGKKPQSKYKDMF
jgi:hypothetical protein